jgi:hypothetical protein
MRTPLPKLTVYTGTACVWQIPLSRELRPDEAGALLTGFDDTLSYCDGMLTLNGSGIRPIGTAAECLGATVTRLRNVLWDMEICTGENPEFLPVSFTAPIADAA